MQDRPHHFLSPYLTRLLSEGRLVLTPEQAQQDLGISKRAFIQAAARQQKRGGLIMPRRGFYVIVPPQFRSLGAPPPSLYIDSLMRHEGRPYYVGLLKAAEQHGATHQAVMQFQVVTDKRLPKIRAGRAAIVFYYRKDMSAIAAGIEQRKTDSGYMRISCRELTMLDLLRYPHAGAGQDHIATVLKDLGEQLDAKKLATLSASFERTVIQRLGYLLDRFGHTQRTGPLHDALGRFGALPWVELQPTRSARGKSRPEPVERNARWNVVVRHMPEPDE